MPDMFIEFLDSLSKFGLEGQGKFYSIYRGYVVDNNDPDKNGRVKVRVDAVAESTIAEWAIPKFYLSGKGKGIFVPPDVEDLVWVSFEMGDPRYPIYEGGHVDENSGVADVFKENYPNRRGMVTKAGHTIYVDDTTKSEKIHVEHMNGSVIELDELGAITITDMGGDKVVLDTVTKKILVKNSTGNYVDIDPTKAEISAVLVNLLSATVNIGPAGTPNAAITAALISLLSQQIQLGQGLPASGGGVAVIGTQATTAFTSMYTALEAANTAIAALPPASDPATVITLANGLKAALTALLTAMDPIVQQMGTTLASTAVFAKK